jgi:hypothetical protein
MGCRRTDVIASCPKAGMGEMEMEKWKFGRKTRNFLIVYSKIFASGPNILFIDYAFVNNQIIIFERNLNCMNDLNSGLVTGNSQPASFYKSYC